MSFDPKTFWGYVLERFTERSTWLGIIGLVCAAGVIMTPDLVSAITTAGCAVASAILIFTKDKASKEG